MKFIIAFTIAAFVISFVPKYIQRRAHRSQWYPQPWYWSISRKAHEIGYPKWPSVRFARKIGWML
jgi:hypothetical protein